ncbi:MAG: magnesium transporter CorA family protein [Limnochordales bacterium]|nr:magnesium transporter CorA family protein [Limnochordales bacterium]
MLRAYREVGGVLQEVHDLSQPGIWIDLVRPDDAELRKVSEVTGLLPEFLSAALDPEERPHHEFEDEQALIVIRVPAARSEVEYVTIPLGIVIAHDCLATVCLEDTPVVRGLMQNARVHPGKKTRLLLQLLYRTARQYLDSVHRLYSKAEQLEAVLVRSMRNEEMFELTEIQKSFVYLTTGLRANHIVMDKLLRSRLRPVEEGDAGGSPLRLYPDDEDLLEDAITENEQALSMAEVYSNILTNTMDAFASIISNNLNIVMKFLAAVTIILAVPQVIGTFFGMNVQVPLASTPGGFAIIILVSVLVSLGATILLWRRRML